MIDEIKLRILQNKKSIQHPFNAIPGAMKEWEWIGVSNITVEKMKKEPVRKSHRHGVQCKKKSDYSASFST
ncbi:MAG: hypothetical protein IJN41_02535 [Firmicutes bacterium]|nr:hypothetical protein [Bacillota bacterium]